MKAYLLTAVGVIFLTVIISFILPEGKLRKSINLILRIVSICVLIQPTLKLFDFKPTEGVNNLDYDYVCQVYSQNQSQLLTKKVNEDLNFDCVCIVDIEYDGTQIKENGVTVDGNFENVQTIETITEYLRQLGYIHITVNEKVT